MTGWRVGGLALLLSSLGHAAPPRVDESEVQARWIAQSGRAVDLEQEGLELVRSAPARLPDDPLTPTDEVSFRLVLSGPAARREEPVQVRSERADGRPLGRLALGAWREISCPPGTPAGHVCRSSVPVRLAIDAEDQAHPVASSRSLQGELAGRVTVAVGGRVVATTRIVGPATSVPGVGRWMAAKLRVFLVRERARGAPPFGFSDAMALSLTRAQIARASSVWGQCGITFGGAEQADVQLVDPPGPVLLSIGCEAGVPAAGGGKVQVRVAGREVSVETAAGELPAAVARRLAVAIEALGFVVAVSDNQRIGPAAAATTDLMVRRRGGGGPLAFEARGPLSTDPQLRACVGSVDLSDGLQHFVDVDAVAGTLEERTLLRALDDGDPRTIDVVLVPSFATGGRIGESFIASDHGSLGNTLLEDRAGIRADVVSFALAHELGHVLLDVPGHSDDYGVDTPTRLMDSDAADPSAFGPRRLTLDECERARRQSGPRAASPLLTPWSPRLTPPSGVPDASEPRPPRSRPARR